MIDDSAGPARVDPEQFEGSIELLNTLEQLYRKDSGHLRPDGTAERGGNPNDIRPVVCLVRDDTRAGLLAAISARLNRARPKPVPHAFVDLPATETSGQSQDSLPSVVSGDVEQVRERLQEVAAKLGATNNRIGRIRRFRRFALVCWLLSTTIPSGPQRADRERELAAKLRGRRRYTSDSQVPNQLVLPWQLHVLGWWLVPFLSTWLRRSGRVPVLSGYYRWFLRQRYMAPREGAGFTEFGLRLTKGDVGEEDQSQVLKLMVHAFLEDIRRVHRGGFGRLRGKRMTTYTTILLNNINRSNGGYTLLRAVNEIRNETGQRDPVLLVTASRRIPPYALSQNEVPDSPYAPEVHPAIEAIGSYNTWRAMVAAARKARDPVAWYLPITIPVPQGGSDVELRGRPAPECPKPAWYTARVVQLAVLLSVLAGGVWWVVDWRADHCGYGPLFTPVVQTDGEACVGVTDGEHNLFNPSGPVSDQVLDTVRRQNLEAEAAHERSPERPYITLVYVSALNSRSNDAVVDRATELQGVAVAQRRQLDVAASSEPILRVLVANAGPGMRRGEWVAGRIAKLAENDPSIVGVVGLGESRERTVRAIDAFAEAGLPVVSATLSADVLADENPMYYQVSPQNRRQAEVAAAWALKQRRDGVVGPTGERLARSVRIYYSDDVTDIYSSNLRADLERSFGRRGFDTESISFTPDGATPPRALPPGSHVNNARAAGRDTCDFNGLAFYASRPIPDFGSFLDGASACDRPPWILAGDDTTRYVANRAARRQNLTVPFHYSSFAVVPQRAQGGEKDFYQTYGVLFGDVDSGGTGRSLDGRSALAYDAARVLLTATSYLRDGSTAIPISPAAIWRQIGALHDDAERGGDRALDGASGEIDFGGDIDQRVPFDKAISIVRVSDGDVDASETAYCGPPGDARTRSWCPASERSGR